MSLELTASGAGHGAHRAWSAVVAFVRRHHLIPPGRPSPGWRKLRPREPRHAASCLLLWAVFGTFIAFWVQAHWGYLADLGLQSDDARTFFPFHGLNEPGLFEGDPIAAEVGAFVTPGVGLIYRILTPFVGLYAATKLVQLLCLGILVGAGWILIRSRRVGLAGGLLLVFLLLHTPAVPGRIAGGLPRGFAFPLYSLWCAGAFSRSERTRFTSAVVAAVVYPPAMAMIIAAEGVFGLLGPRGSIMGWLKRYALLVLLCAMAGLAYSLPRPDSGPIHTLAEAQSEPAFGPEGRLKVLPFQNPVPYVSWAFSSPFLPVGRSLAHGLPGIAQTLGSTTALMIITLLLALVALRLTSAPRAAFAFFCAAVFLYALARVLAYHLYFPIRYLQYGMPIAAILLGTSAVGLVLPRLRPRPLRAAARNVCAFLFIGGLCLVNGDGLVVNNGMTVEGYSNAELHAAIRRLPIDVRIACHPWEADGITYWGQRQATDGYETLMVWFTEDWKRQKKRTQDTLLALYATRPSDVLDYCERNGVTHFLIRTDRYGPDLRQGAALFEPLTRFINEHLATVSREELVFLHVPASSIIFEEGPYRLIDVAALGSAWAGELVTGESRSQEVTK